MTHHIVNSVRSLAMFGAVSLGLRRSEVQARIQVREPEERRSGAEPDDLTDSWMFDRPQTAVSSEVFMLNQEYNRASGALSGLRSILSNLMKMPLAAEETYQPVSAGTVAFDSVLFDEISAPAPVLTNVVAFDEDDLFIESSLTLQKPSASIESLSRVA